ncbi:hypothetical protein STEG23_024823 [Scotinomys teguina]
MKKRWFNTDEDDMEDGEAVVSPSDKTKNDDDIMDPQVNSWKGRNGGLVGLVDYPDDDEEDDEDEDKEDTLPLSKKAKFES